MTTTIHFVRHGTVYNPTNTFYGRRPRFGLSEQGRAEAVALAPFFAGRPLAAAYASPLLRTRQTARAFLNGRTDLLLSLTRDLIEVNAPYEGHPLADLEARRWDIYTGNQPPYETPADVLRRVQRFIHRTLLRHTGQEVVAVTHADVILFISLWAKGYEATYPNKALVEQRLLDMEFPQPASITSLNWEDPTALPEMEYRRVT
jgi:broad specificity phosphatase PhoE